MTDVNKTRRPMINYYANLTATIAFYYSVLVQHTL